MITSSRVEQLPSWKQVLGLKPRVFHFQMLPFQFIDHDESYIAVSVVLSHHPYSVSSIGSQWELPIASFDKRSLFLPFRISKKLYWEGSRTLWHSVSCEQAVNRFRRGTDKHFTILGCSLHSLHCWSVQICKYQFSQCCNLRIEVKSSVVLQSTC